jgi:tripartite-type tricarboxylate transporter receptor subunit TctC
MPGATTMLAANYLYSVAKPDGLTIGSIDRGLPLAQLLHAEGARFDLRKFSWIGSAASESTILCIRNDLPYKTYSDLLAAKEPIIFGSVGPANTGHQFVLFLTKFAGLKARQVVYPSSADVMLAIQRKEVDGCALIYNSMKPHIEKGLIHPVVRSRVSQAGIEKLPVNEDLTSDKMGKTLMGMLSVGDQVGRPYLAPPGVSPQTMKLLRDAFAKMSKDPQLAKEAERAMMDVEYLPADEALKIVSALLNQPPEIVNEFGKYVKF